MAKKPLTPEQAEIKAMKKAKKSENWTKFWAILLAAALTFAVVAMGKTAAEDALNKSLGGNETEQSGGESTDSSSNTDSWVDSGSDDTTTNDGGSTNTPSTDDGAANTPSNDGGSNSSATSNTADAIKALNDATAKAAKASYNWTRDAKFTQDVKINPAFLTSAVDSIIKGIDENSSLNSVVGGFLGIKEQPLTASVKNGKLPDEGMGDAKYLLVATTLKEAHVDNVQVNGNTYKIKLKDSITPKGNKATALENASNDFITVAEVNKNIASFTTAISVKDSSVASYKDIVITAVIENGNLVSFQLDYNLSAVLELSIGAKGEGAAKISSKYTDFKY